MITKIATNDEFKRKLEAWLKYRELDMDHKFYTSEEWEARKETDIGNTKGFHIHLVSDGPFATEMHFGGDIENEFALVVARCGWCFEQGFAWSWHFYPLNNIDDANSSLAWLLEPPKVSTVVKTPGPIEMPF